MKWLLLILTLPSENTSARMRAWRALKSVGAAVLRDGVYVLPADEAKRQALSEIAGDVEASGGTVYLLETSATEYALDALFDRTGDYQRIAQDVQHLVEQVTPAQVAEQQRQARKLRKAFEAVRAIDFFPGEATRQTEALLNRLTAQLAAAAHDGEPSARDGGIPRRAIAEFQGRRWATRKRPWVDRLASAWLIRRFIDPQARFVWLETPADCPGDALGFDFDGAPFSHVGERVTFETLLAGFGLEADPALARLARIVHCLDVGGLPAAEAPGLELLLAGMRTALADDDALLEAASGAFDYLHASLKESP